MGFFQSRKSYKVSSDDVLLTIDSIYDRKMMNLWSPCSNRDRPEVEEVIQIHRTEMNGDWYIYP